MPANFKRHVLVSYSRRFTFDDDIDEIGIIAPVSHPCCGPCSRVRLTSEVKIRTCFFSPCDHDLYGRLRSGGSDEDLQKYLRRVMGWRDTRHPIDEPDFQNRRGT